ncbi:MAG: 3-deoxy-8-phosphooctulonate synthase, partial [Candidatus Omnitrophota bacterium]
MMREITVKNIHIGEKKPAVLIAGPCVIESQALCLDTAKRIKDITHKLGIPYIFKSSFDKANRMSIGSFRGPGIKKGLEILNKVKQQLKLPILSDVHCVKDMAEAAKVLDIIQIPAFLSRQTDIVLAAARTG